MKIKLILAASTTDPLRRNDPFMPLSLPILAATAPDHDYTFIDMLQEDDVRLDEPVDLVGISARYTAEKRSYEIADAFRRRGIKVVLGGAQPSVVPLRAKRFADAVAVGEAETLWPVIVEHASQNALKDFYVCAPRPFNPEGFTVYQDFEYPYLSNIATPLRKLYKRRYTFDTVYATRGCDINCDFCCVTSLFGPRYRHRPAEQVVAEINTFRNYYYLLDDTVWGRPSTYDYYLDLYDRIAKLKKRRYWTGQANLDAAAGEQGREVIRASVRAHFLYAAIGMESINPKTLEKSGCIKKAGAGSGKNVIERMKENIRFIQDQGILVSGWFVLGYEDDTIETYHRTYEFCREMNIIPAIFYVKAIQGSRLYERLRRENKLDDSRLINFRNPALDDDTVIETLRSIADKGFTVKEILKRTARIVPKFKSDRIHKTIFCMVTQFKLKGGIDMTHDEFYSERGMERNILQDG